MATVIDRVKVGQVEVTKFQGSYEGKPTTSYGLKKSKFNKETKKYEDTPFLGVTDLKDAIVACQIMLMKHYAPDTDVKEEPAPF